MKLHIVTSDTDRAEDSQEQPAGTDASWVDAIPVGLLAFVGHDVVAVNERWTEMTGLGLAESAGNGWLRAFETENRAALRRFIARARAGSDAIGDWRLVGPGRRDGVWAQGRAHHVDGEASVTRVVTFTELDTHVENENDLLHLATHDSLTGLLNRRVFLSQVDHAIANQRSDSDLLAVLFVDLDRFKEVNDALGHQVGDSLLAMTCRRLRSSLRSTDCAGRVGGDEVGVLCPMLSSKGEAFGVAQRIVKSIAQPFHINGEHVHISASVGLAFSDGESTTAEQLMHEADNAMYREKGRRLDEPGAWLYAAAEQVADVETTLIALWRQSMDLRDDALLERLADASHALRHAAEILRNDVRLR